MKQKAIKAKIEKIGTVENGYPVGFAFSSENWDVAVFDIQSDGSVVHCGYTVEELKDIADEKLKPLKQHSD